MNPQYRLFSRLEQLDFLAAAGCCPELPVSHKRRRYNDGMVESCLSPAPAGPDTVISISANRDRDHEYMMPDIVPEAVQRHSSTLFFGRSSERLPSTVRWQQFCYYTGNGW